MLGPGVSAPNTDSNKITPRPVKAKNSSWDTYELVFNTDGTAETAQDIRTGARRSRVLFHLSKTPIPAERTSAYFLSLEVSSLNTKRPGYVTSMLLNHRIIGYDEALKEAARIAALTLYEVINADLEFMKEARKNITGFIDENNMSWKS